MIATDEIETIAMDDEGAESDTESGNLPPLQPDQEWANALTHGIATVGALVVGSYMVSVAASKESGLGIACAAYVASVVGTFLFSTLSHIVRRQPLLNTMRAWDQAMIYTMISGTYTPIIYAIATEWIASLRCWRQSGLRRPPVSLGKVALRHRINSIGTISYLMLGWLPALPLVGHVPAAVVWSMVAGGVLYTAGVVFLMNDAKAEVPARRVASERDDGGIMPLLWNLPLHRWGLIGCSQRRTVCDAAVTIQRAPN